MALAAALVCLLALAGSSSAGGFTRRPAQTTTTIRGTTRGTRGTRGTPKHLSRIAKVVPRHFSGPRKLAVNAQGAVEIQPELDFSTEDVQRSQFQASDFVLDFAKAGASTPFGSAKGETVNDKPALATLPNGGVAQTLVTLEACAINQPHSHPRGTEFSFVTKGQLFFGFIEENLSAATKTGGRFLGSDVPQGNSIVIPQGLIHFAINRSCNQSQFIASFPTRDQGTQTTLTSLFREDVPTDVLRATTGLSDRDIAAIRHKVKANANPSVDPDCLKRCGF